MLYRLNTIFNKNILYSYCHINYHPIHNKRESVGEIKDVRTLGLKNIKKTRTKPLFQVGNTGYNLDSHSTFLKQYIWHNLHMTQFGGNVRRGQLENRHLSTG